MKKFLAVLFVTLFSVSNAYADKKNDEIIKNIEDYLNNIKTMEADFIQSATNNSFAEGKLYIKKPNKINMQYSEDAGISIIGDGKYIVYHDKELDQVTHINYKDIPATIILGNDIKIDGKKIIAKDIYQDAGITMVTFEYEASNNIPPITLVFNNKPFELKQWSTKDAKGIVVTLSLYNIKKDISLKDDLFKFKNKKLDPMAN